MFKVEVSNSELNKQLKRCCEVIPSSTPSPILNNVLIIFEDGDLRFVTTDLTNSVNARVMLAGSAFEGVNTRIMVDAKKLLAMAGTFSEKRITVYFNDKNNTLYLSSNRRNLEVVCYCDAESFPLHMVDYEFDDYDRKCVFYHEAVPVSVFSRAILHTEWALPEKKENHECNNFFFKVKDGNLTCYAYTDVGVAKYEVEGIAKLKKDCEFIMPTKVLSKLARYKNEEKEFALFVEKAYIRIELDEAEITMRTAAVPYPNFELYMKEFPNDKCTVSPLILSEGIESLAPVAEDVIAKVQLKVEDGELTCAARHGATSAGKITINVKDSGINPMSGTFNLKQVCKALSGITAPETKLHFDMDSRSPKMFVVGTYGEGIEKTSNLLMAMNVNII